MRSLLVALCATACAHGPVPEGAATRIDYDIILADRVAGFAHVVIASDGTVDEESIVEDRGHGPRLKSRIIPGPEGFPARIQVVGWDDSGDEVHTLATCAAARCAWKSANEHGEGGPGFYIPVDAPTYLDTLALRAAQVHGGTLSLLPAGTLRVERIAEVTVSAGDEKRHVVAWQLSGMGMTPYIEWFDDDGTFFAAASDWGSAVRHGWREAIPALLAAQQPLGARWREEVSRRVSHRPAGGLAVVHARLFNPERKTARDDMTIVVDGAKITAVGPGLPAPAGHEVIDAAGKTVLPGLWDMHVHLSDEDGLGHLMAGVTTVRDLGSDVDASLVRRQRWDEGAELGPHLLLAALIDGPGQLQGPTKLIVDDEAAARALVDDVAKKGYLQVKLYSSLRPALVPIIAAEAHARGLRVSGHVPAHMIAEDAVRAGYDELQHINFLVLDLVSDRTLDTRSPNRFVVPAVKGASIDLDAPATRALIDLLVEKKTVIDPTLAIFEVTFTGRPGQPTKILAPALARLPAQMQRGAYGGGLPVPDDMDATYRESFRRCQQLVKRLWERGVTIVAGTDEPPGFALHRELELYVEAGIPVPDVLAIATLGAARVMHREARSGSVAVGKDADLVIFSGDPVARIGDVRTAVTVIKDGVVIDVAKLDEALSVKPL